MNILSQFVKKLKYFFINILNAVLTIINLPKDFNSLSFHYCYKMSAQIDCPICMDAIEINKNCVTTECGHCFHASCLMTSVAHNGFGCPYCRTAMAEAPEEDEETEYESDDEEEEEDMFDDDALRGFRFFFNNLDGEAHDAEDITEEEEMEQEEEVEDAQEPDPNVPTTDFVAQKLREQGVTFEQLVKMLCNLDHEEYNGDDEAERFGDELFGKMRIIISNYQPEQAAPAPAIPVQLPVVPLSVDFDAQPKTNQVRTHRIIMHV